MLDPPKTATKRGTLLGVTVCETVKQLARSRSWRLSRSLLLLLVAFLASFWVGNTSPGDLKHYHTSFPSSRSGLCPSFCGKLGGFLLPSSFLLVPSSCCELLLSLEAEVMRVVLTAERVCLVAWSVCVMMKGGSTK